MHLGQRQTRGTHPSGSIPGGCLSPGFRLLLEAASQFKIPGIGHDLVARPWPVGEERLMS